MELDAEKRYPVQVLCVSQILFQVERLLFLCMDRESRITVFEIRPVALCLLLIVYSFE